MVCPSSREVGFRFAHEMVERYPQYSVHLHGETRDAVRYLVASKTDRSLLLGVYIFCPDGEGRIPIHGVRLQKSVIKKSAIETMEVPGPFQTIDETLYWIEQTFIERNENDVAEENLTGMSGDD